MSTMREIARGNYVNSAIAQHNEQDEIGNELLMLLFFLESNNGIRETDPAPTAEQLLQEFKRAHPRHA